MVNGINIGMFDTLNIEERRKIYNETLDDIIGCCDYYSYSFEEMDGVCPECGRATCGRECVCGCCYSPTMCECCGAKPCDGSC